MTRHYVIHIVIIYFAKRIQIKHEIAHIDYLLTYYKILSNERIFQCHLSKISFTHDTFSNTLRPRQDSRHFADDDFKCIFVNEFFFVLFKFSLKFIHWGSIYNKSALFYLMPVRITNRHPASFWTNDGLFYWRMYASFGMDEVTKTVCTVKSLI